MTLYSNNKWVSCKSRSVGLRQKFKGWRKRVAPAAPKTGKVVGSSSSKKLSKTFKVGKKSIYRSNWKWYKFADFKVNFVPTMAKI